MAPQSENLRGILLMVASMASFTFADLFLKLSTESLPTGEVMMAFGIGCAIGFYLILYRRGERAWNRAFFEPSVVLHNFGEVVATIGIFVALAYAPLSLVSMIMQTLPLVLTLFAFLFLKESIGIHRISAVAVGFVGVLMIIRPGMDDFNLYSLIAVFGVLGMSMRDIGSRLTRKSISTILLSFYSSLLVTLTGVGMLYGTEGLLLPNSQTWLYLFGMIVLGGVGLVLLTTATRIGELSVISPFRYSRIFFASAVGVMILGETIDFMTYFGGALIVVAGIYVWIRERRIQTGKPLPQNV
jgi:drug/metabolite transporter (DMT)-like permease